MPGPSFYVWTAPKVVRGLSLAVILALLLTSDGFRDRFHVVNQVTFSPDGRWLAAGSYSWKKKTGASFKIYAADVCRKVTLINLDNDSDRTVIAEEMRNGNQGPLRHFTPRIQFGPGDDELTVLLARRGTLQVWNLKHNVGVERKEEFARNMDAFAYSQDGEMLAAYAERQLVLWNLKTLRSSQLISPDAYSLFMERAPISFAPNPRKLLLAGTGSEVNIWDTDSGKLVGTIPREEKSSVEWSAFSVDGDLIATVESTGVHLWMVDDVVDPQQTPVKTTLPDSSGAQDIAFLTDGRSLAVVGYQGFRVYDLRTLQVRAAVSFRALNFVACSPDGKLLATGDFEGHVTLWDARSLKRLRSIRIRDVVQVPR